MSKVPHLVAELLRRGWSDKDVQAALGENLIRVMKEVEKVRRGSWERSSSGCLGTQSVCVLMEPPIQSGHGRIEALNWSHGLFFVRSPPVGHES